MTDMPSKVLADAAAVTRSGGKLFEQNELGFHNPRPVEIERELRKNRYC
jgi:hypothetical protein